MVRQDQPVFAGVTLVDDEPWVLDVLAQAAQRWHYECQLACSAEEAIRLLERHLTPIVVTDIRMPGKGGVWLVSEIHRRWPEVGIIVVTAGHERDLVTECLEAGAHHFFLKPINLDEFHHALETTARNYVLQKENQLYRNFLEQTVRRKTHRLRHTFLSAIDSLVRALEARDQYTFDHSRRVCHFAVALARGLGFDRKTVARVRLSARLHDIGKVGLPEAVLNKAGPLTDAERAIVRRHPVIGEEIISPIVRCRHVLGGIRNHHERYDGFGYPDGFCGDEIPLIARLIAIADCFEALTSPRVYRKALSVADALDFLREGSGAQFDPAFVPPFLDLVREGMFADLLTVAK